MTPAAPDRWLVVRARLSSRSRTPSVGSASAVTAESGAPPGDRAGASTSDTDGSEDPLRDLLADALLGLGGRAVQEVGGWLVTHVPEPSDPVRWMETAKRELERRVDAAVEVRTEWQRQEDWAHLWKRGLVPRRVTDRLVVSPTWEDPDVRDGDIVLRIDPGMAFGTAEHGTTRGCLRLLDGTVREGDRVVDVGAGSALLSIAAARLGATVLALEADPYAVDAARKNVAANGVGDRVSVRQGWATVERLRDLGPRDGVVANIATGVLSELLPGFRAALAGDGWLILSGVPADEWPDFEPRVTARGFRCEEVDADGEWRSGLFRALAEDVDVD